MKRILLLLTFVTSMAYGQVSNTTATNFTNSLEASRIFNLPALVATPPVGIKVGGLSYNTTTFKLASWNGTAWIYYVTELNAQNTYVPLTRSITINGVTQDLSQNRNWTIATSGGTVTNFSKTDGLGIVSTVTNPTTTPNHNISVDTTTIRTAANSASLSQLQSKFNSDAILNNQTNTPEAKRISVSDSIKTTSVTTFAESNLYGTVDRTVNYERLRNYFSNNIFNINTENGGSGTKRILSIGIGGIPALPTSDASQSYTLFNTNPAIVGSASGYGITTVKVGLNQPGLVGSQVFTKASLTSSVAGQGIIGGGFITFLGASNTFNWTTLSNQHPNIQGLSSVVGQSVGATGSLPKVAAIFGTVTGGGAAIEEANLLNLTYGHVGTINKAVGARITDVNAGTNNTFLLMNMGDATAAPDGQNGIYGDYSYNNYFGTGNSLFGSKVDNGANVQIFHIPVDALPGLTLDGNQSVGGKQISFKNIGVEYSYIDNNGRLFGSGTSNYGSVNNSSFNTTVNGAIATRNIADAGKAFVARQINSGSTGDIFDAQFINPAGSKFKIDYRGVIGINGTLLTALQSFRTNAAGTASEAFTPQSLITLTTTGTGAATFNPGTGALNIPTNSSSTGTVTSVATTGNNGISGIVTNPTTTPSIALTADTTVLRTAANSLTKAQTQTALNLKGNLTGDNDWNGNNYYNGFLSVNGTDPENGALLQNTVRFTNETDNQVLSIEPTVVETGNSYGIIKFGKYTYTGNTTSTASVRVNSSQTVGLGIDLQLPPFSGTLARIQDIPTFTGGTVTSFSKTDGFGVISTVTNPTTTPNYTSRVDSSTVRTVANSLSLSQLQTRFNGYELTANKQNSLATDATNLKYPTVTAVNSALANYVTTNSSQTGLSGTKEWTGIHRFLNPILVGVSTGFNVTYSGTGTVVTTNGGTTSFTQNIPLKNGTYALVEDLPKYISVPSGTTAVSLIGNATYGFHATTLTTATLPSTNPAEGTLITLIGIGAGQFKISQNASQYIVSGNATTTVGTDGYIQTTTNNTTITIRYLDTNRWQVTSSNSAPTIN